MVRLVFRPYTKIRPLICTLKPLRASIRVSSDFALFWHSSPSFGSQHIRSYSVLKHRYIQKNISLSFRQSTLQSVRLAYMLDSLVRVSRRVGRFGFYFFQELLDSLCPPAPCAAALHGSPVSAFHPRPWHAHQPPAPAVRPFVHSLFTDPPDGCSVCSSQAITTLASPPSCPPPLPHSSPGPLNLRPCFPGKRDCRAALSGSACPPSSSRASNPPLISPSTVSRPPLTLFPKYFSSFPHGTCSLSVSCLYLALDDAYHPFQAALPNNPTPQSIVKPDPAAATTRDSHPL